MSRQRRIPKLRFAPEEDEILIETVQTHGTSDWLLIASFLPGRNPRQCRERWANYVNPNLVKKGWTHEEDALLIQKYNELGPQWEAISKMFEGRARNNLKNRFLTIQRQKARDMERFPDSKTPENTTKVEEDIITKGILALLNRQTFDSPARMNITGLTVRHFVFGRETQ
jgi:hypothetical protein